MIEAIYIYVNLVIICKGLCNIHRDLLSEIFGDRVKHWITFNEPHTFAVQGKYLVGVQSFFVYSVRAGNLATEPYIVAHNMDLLSGLNLLQTPQKTLKQHKEPKISSLTGKENNLYLLAFKEYL